MIIIKKTKKGFQKKARERYQNLSAEEKYKKPPILLVSDI